MSDSNLRDEPAGEVLDLYDVLPERTQARPAETEDDPLTSMIKNTGRNFAAIMGMFAVSVAAFIACTALFSLGLGLLVVVVGLFILVGCLIVAGWSSRMTMALLSYVGITLRPTHYPAAGPSFRGKLRRLAYPQSWRDLLHVLINFILSVITFSLAMAWVFGGLGGVTYWFWSRWLSENDRGLPDLLGYPGRFADVTVHTVLGTVLLLTTPLLLRGVAQLLVARRRTDPLGALSAREREVLALMAEGRSNAAIAERLVVTGGAVEKHISNIFAKINLPDLGSDNRRVLAVLAWLRAR